MNPLIASLILETKTLSTLIYFKQNLVFEIQFPLKKNLFVSNLTFSSFFFSLEIFLNLAGEQIRRQLMTVVYSLERKIFFVLQIELCK